MTDRVLVPTAKNSKLVGVSFIVLAALTWSGTGPWVKLIQISPSLLAFVRAAVPALLIGLLLFWQRASYRFILSRTAVVPGLLNGARLFLWIFAMQSLPVGKGMVLTYASPIFSTLFAYYLLGEKLTHATIVALILGVFGVIFVTDGQLVGLLPSLIMLTSAAIWGLTNVLTKRGLSSLSALQMLFAHNFYAALIVGFAPMVNPLPSIKSLLMACCYAILSGVIGFGLYFRGLKYLAVAQASVITYVELVFAIVLAFFLLGEIPSFGTLLGAICVFASGATIAWEVRRRDVALAS